MKKIQKEFFVCEICGEEYEAEEGVRLCEAKPVSQDKGVRVGDIVRITFGDGSGELAKVVRLGVAGRTYGHYQYDRYWHTVVIWQADIVDGFGSRVLTFDCYEVV